MLQLFRDRYDASELEQRTPLLLVQSAIDDVKLPDASVDTVVIAAVLLHNPKPVTRAVLREAHRVLRPGGRILVLNDLPNSRTPATLPNRLYVLALEVSGRRRPERTGTDVLARRGRRAVRRVRRRAGAADRAGRAPEAHPRRTRRR